MPPHEEDDTTTTTQDLIQLASEEGVSCVRGPDNVFTDWPTWAAQHPQRHDESVQVHFGRMEWQTQQQQRKTNPLTITMVSWNVLSNTWYLASPEDYTHVTQEDGAWSTRFARIVAWIDQLRPDVLTLQEVDFEQFDTEWLPALSALGYDGRMQSRRNHSARQPCGVATFFQSHRLQPAVDSKTRQEQVVSFSRTMALRFQVLNNTRDDESQPTSRFVTVINAHLESTQRVEGFIKRAKQLNSALAWAARVEDKGSHNAVLMGGDFNTGNDSQLFAVLRHYAWHGHAWAHAFEHPATVTSLPVCRETFCVPGHHYKIDHLLYTHEYLRLRGVLSAFDEAEMAEHMPAGTREWGLPNLICPSDHVPIGAIFDLLDDKDLSVIVKPELPTLDEATQKRLREEWTQLVSKRPTTCKGKPSPDELVQRQDHAQRVKAWKNAQGTQLEQEFCQNLIKGRI